MKKLILALGMTVSFFACKHYYPDPSPNHGQHSQWSYKRLNKLDTAKVENGGLHLVSSSRSITDVFTPVAVMGDFEMHVTYSKFLFCENAQSVGFALVEGGKDLRNPFVIGLLSLDSIILKVGLLDTISSRSSSQEAEFFVKREGDSCTFSIISEFDSLQLNKIHCPKGNLSIHMFAKSDSPFVPPSGSRASVLIKNFNISGGGGFIKSDLFDKNNLSVF